MTYSGASAKHAKCNGYQPLCSSLTLQTAGDAFTNIQTRFQSITSFLNSSISAHWTHTMVTWSCRVAVCLCCRRLVCLFFHGRTVNLMVQRFSDAWFLAPIKKFHYVALYTIVYKHELCNSSVYTIQFNRICTSNIIFLDGSPTACPTYLSNRSYLHKFSGNIHFRIRIYFIALFMNFRESFYTDMIIFMY